MPSGAALDSGELCDGEAVHRGAAYPVCCMSLATASSFCKAALCRWQTAGAKPRVTVDTSLSSQCVAALLRFAHTGALEVADLTLEAAERKLNARLHGIVVNPDANISVVNQRFPYVSVVGEVRSPGRFPMEHEEGLLAAIALAGAAGLQLGWALIAPGQLTRGESLRLAARKSVQMLCGVMLFLLIAAFIEAYWSSTTLIAPWVKYLVGAALWLLVVAYLSLAGRTRHAPQGCQRGNPPTYCLGGDGSWRIDGP